MREAIGGSQLLLIIVTLIIVIMMVLAGSVGYTKAFKAKNAIINFVQENGAYDKSAAAVLNEAEDDIDNLLKEMGYKEVIGVNLKCSDKDYDNVIDYAQGSNYNFCVYHFQEPESKSRYYGVKTFMYFELPLFGRNDMFAIPIYGETYSFYEIR